MESLGSETVKLFRAVNSSSPGFKNATKGGGVLKGGNATPEAHNSGNTNSNFTSWTANIEVAKNYALRKTGEGVVMEVNVPKSNTVASPSVKNVNLRQSPGVRVKESEVLLKGRVIGATTTPINE